MTSVTVRFQKPVPFPTGAKPELNPSWRGSQGVANDDWATEWFAATNWKVTTVFGWVTLMNWGSNLRPPAPTWTCEIEESGRITWSVEDIATYDDGVLGQSNRGKREGRDGSDEAHLEYRSSHDLEAGGGELRNN